MESNHANHHKQGLHTMSKAPTANQLQESIFRLEAYITESRADGDWNRVDYLCECLDAYREDLEAMTQSTN